MRTYSTPQSALNLEITKLAILECVASVVIYVSVGVYFGTFKYLALAIVVAPLMLFRTEVSADWGLEVYGKFFDKLKNLPETQTVLLAFILGPIVGTLIRIIATLYWVIRRPLHTLKETPQNWLRQSFCTDFFHPPEVVPLEALKGDPVRIITFADVFDFKGARLFQTIYVIVMLLPLIVIGYLPSMIYRISFKATALVYTPFIWATHMTLKNPLSVKTRLERITKGELEKVRRGLSYVVLTTLAAKVALVYGWVDRSYLESKFPSQKFVQFFVVLYGWPWWQITLAVDALLTFFLLYFADAALARLEGQQAWREDAVLKTISSISFVRAALSIITISHFFYIALEAIAPPTVLRLLSA